MLRPAFAAAFVLGAAAVGHAQPVADPGPRYGVKPRIRQYPQATPKEAMRSAVTTAERNDYAYLVAQLLDPQFVDAAVAERATRFVGGAEIEFARLRDYQQANPDRVARENRVPLDPVAFRALAAAKARERGYAQLVKDVSEKLTDDPQGLAELRLFSRGGTFAETAPTASVTHPDVTGRALYFKKVGERWFLGNRKTEEPKKDPPPGEPPPPKPNP